MFSSIFATLFTAIKWVCGWWGQMLFGTYNGVKLTVPFSGFGNYGLTAKKSSLFSSFKEDDWRNDNAVDSGGDQCVTKPKIWTKSNPKLFSDTNFCQYQIRYFFRCKIFWNRYRYPPKKWKSFETEKFWNRNVTLWCHHHHHCHHHTLHFLLFRLV